MNCNTPSPARLNPSGPDRNAPAPAATDLAHDMLDSGWTLSGATVRVIHTARLTDDSGLTVAVTSEAGKVRLAFDSEYRRLDGDLDRYAWHAEADCELPVEALAAISSVNTAASDQDPTPLADWLTAAGWSRPRPQHRNWFRSPDGNSEVLFLDDEPLPWEIHHKTARPVTIYTCADTPASVIAAFALTEAAADSAIRFRR